MTQRRTVLELIQLYCGQLREKKIISPRKEKKGPKKCTLIGMEEEIRHLTLCLCITVAMCSSASPALHLFFISCAHRWGNRKHRSTKRKTIAARMSQRILGYRFR